MGKRKIKSMIEFTTMWKYLTKKQICDHYNINPRTLRDYRKKLDLPFKPIGKKDVCDLDTLPIVFISNHPDNVEPEKYVLHEFDDHDHLESELSKYGGDYKIYVNLHEKKVIPYIRLKRYIYDSTRMDSFDD